MRKVILALLLLVLLLPLLSLIQEANAGEPFALQSSTYSKTITTPSYLFNGQPQGGNVSVTYSASPKGSLVYTNPQGDNFTIKSMTFNNKKVVSDVYANSSLIGFNFNKTGGDVSGWVYFKVQKSGSYTSTDFKVRIVGTATQVGSFCLNFENSKLKAEKYDSDKKRIMYGGLGFDASDSLSYSPVYDSSGKKLCWSVGLSFDIDPATVGTSTDAAATQWSFQLKTFTAQTREWLFYGDGTNCVWRTSTDNGDTWSSVTNVRACTQGAYISVYYDSVNNVLYYAYGNDGGSTQFFYRYGTPASDGTISWSIAETGVTTTNPGAESPYIFATSTSDIWVTVFTQTAPNLYFEVWRYNGVSWADKLDVSMGTAFPGRSTRILGLTSGKALVYVDGTDGQACVRTTGDNGDTWTSEVCSTSTNFTNNNRNHATAVGDVVHFAGTDTTATPNAKYWNCTYPCSSVSAEITIVSLASMNGVSVSADSSNIIVLYNDGSNVYYKASTNGGTSFGSQQTISSTETSIQEGSLTSSLVLTSSAAQIAWTAGSASPYNVRFDEETFTVSQTITLNVSPASQATFTFTLSGASVSPTSAAGDGSAVSITCISGQTVTITAPAAGADTRARFAADSTTADFTCDTTNDAVTYYSEQRLSVRYILVGGGSPTAPSITRTVLGASGTTALTQSAADLWVDAATTWSTTNPLTGSGTTERWVASSGASGTASAGASVNPSYQHQYLLTNSQSLSVTRTNNGTSAVITGNGFVDSATSLTVAATYSCSFTLNNASSIAQFTPSGLQIFTDAAASSLGDFTTGSSPYVTFTGTNIHVVMCIPNETGLTINQVTTGGTATTYNYVSPRATWTSTGTSVAIQADFTGSTPPSSPSQEQPAVQEGPIVSIGGGGISLPPPVANGTITLPTVTPAANVPNFLGVGILGIMAIMGLSVFIGALRERGIWREPKVSSVDPFREPKRSKARWRKPKRRDD